MFSSRRLRQSTVSFSPTMKDKLMAASTNLFIYFQKFLRFFQKGLTIMTNSVLVKCQAKFFLQTCARSR
ncbi:unnamed protein product, partial [Larinioides sclopetarius]